MSEEHFGMAVNEVEAALTCGMGLLLPCVVVSDREVLAKEYFA